MPLGKSILDLFKVPVFKPKETQFFYDIIEATLEARRNNKVKRNDIIELMLQAVKEGKKRVFKTLTFS